MPNPDSSLQNQVLKQAQRFLARPPVKRAYRFADVAPEYLVTQTATLTGSRREYFALAMSDAFQNWEVAETLPLYTAAARLCADPQIKADLHARLLEQLAEVAMWKKLNRPGWTLYENGPPVPDGFNDGNWLGTGSGLRGIVTTLRAAGDTIPAPLREKLRALLRQEVASVLDDFATHRPWYWNSPTSNQFVVPNTGVVLAALELGRADHQAAYEFAVQNVLRSLDAQGRDGAHHEGAQYAAYTTREILYAALAAAAEGDRRLLDHPHVAHVGSWLLHMLQPGHHLVNCFDGADRGLSLEPPALDGKLGATQVPTRYYDSLLLAAMATGQPEMSAAIAQAFPSLYPSALSLQYAQWAQRHSASRQLPKPFADYTSSPLVTWRSSWDDMADGVWVRGGAPADGHDHRDHGHVNYIVGGREVLIEAGSTDYAATDFEVHFTAGLGHNVLQIGSTAAGVQIGGTGAPISVKHLDENGGELVVNVTAGYDPKLLKDWQRKVAWDRSGLKIEDAVTLAEGRPDTVLFRWHLAENVPATITPAQDGRTARVTWTGGAMTLEADAPLQVTTAELPHGTSYTGSRELHTCLLVQSQKPVTALRLVTSLKTADCGTK